MVKYLLSVGADHNICKKNGWSVVHVASEHGHLEAPRIVVESLPDDASRREIINKQSPSGITPLYFACRHGRDDIVKYLLSVGADYNICTKGGWNVAHVICEQGNLGILKLIIESLPDGKSRSEFINKKSDSGITPLFLACQHGKKDIAKYLLSIGADYNICTRGGWSITHVACEKGNLEILKLIIESLPDDSSRNEFVNKQSDNGETPLFLACKHDKKDMAEYLLSIGADCFIQDDFGYGPMHVVARNGSLEVLKALLGISTGNTMQPRLVNGLGAGDATPLWIACQYGHLNVVQFLLSCREVSLHPLISLNEELVTLASEYNIEVEKRMKEKLQDESGLIQYREKTQISLLDIASIMGHTEITSALNVYMNGNPDKGRLQQQKTYWDLQCYKNFSDMVYSSLVHKTFQAAYEKGQKESQKERREEAGYGEGAIVVHSPAKPNSSLM